MTDVQPKRRQRRATVVPDLNMLPDQALLTRDQVAQLTSFSLPTLKLWAKLGKGPKLVRVEGRPRYPAGALRQWAAGQGNAS